MPRLDTNASYDHQAKPEDWIDKHIYGSSHSFDYEDGVDDIE